MNAPANHDETVLPSSARIASSSPVVLEETSPATDDTICWIEVHQFPYAPDQQVELLHLQAEAEALLLQLQAVQQKRSGLERILSE